MGVVGRGEPEHVPPWQDVHELGSARPAFQDLCPANQAPAFVGVTARSLAGQHDPRATPASDADETLALLAYAGERLRYQSVQERWAGGGRPLAGARQHNGRVALRPGGGASLAGWLPDGGGGSAAMQDQQADGLPLDRGRAAHASTWAGRWAALVCGSRDRTDWRPNSVDSTSLSGRTRHRRKWARVNASLLVLWSSDCSQSEREARAARQVAGSDRGFSAAVYAASQSATRYWRPSKRSKKAPAGVSGLTASAVSRLSRRSASRRVAEV